MPRMWRTILALALVAGCRDNPPVTYPTAVRLDDTQLSLGPGDKLEIVVYAGTRTNKWVTVLSDSGEIEIQYIGSVVASGKTAAIVQDEIQTKLGDGYLIDPIVSLVVLEINSRKVAVLGQVQKTGTVKFTPGMTITEAIAHSGGFSPMARKNMVKVTRVVDGQKHIFKVPVEMIAEGSRPNFPMLPGDEVFVPERPW
jgi:protein involved in polysaccharide export with SLBB domain